MTRWHSPSCQSPIVWVGGDCVPRCKACGASAHEQLRQLRAHPSNPVPSLPPDEKAGQLNLYWPSSVPYTRNQTAALAEEIHDSLQISNPHLRTQKSLIHGRTLAKDEFRLICLTAEEKDLPAEVIHLSLETYKDGNFPDYEAASYTWGGEDGDDTLRHPIYISEHWDILPQTRNCYAMLRYLRPSRGIRMVWVDAICINQEDIQERADQVAKMDQLYTGCFQVFLWLGDDVAFKKPGVHPPRLPLHELENLKELQLPNKTEQEKLPELLALTWKSRSSDLRDKVYGVLGLSSVKEGVKIRPDYGISLQHLLIGSLAHCIINGGAPQLLLKAAGTSAETGIPSWMPHWRGDAWEELFRSTDKEDLAWEKVEAVLVEANGFRPSKGTTRARPEQEHKRPCLVRFLPGSFFGVKSKVRKTVFDRRPWHQNATVDADTGAMSLNLTRLVSIKNRPTTAYPFGGERLYRINNTRKMFCEDVIFVMSRSKLDEVVEAGDEIFLLDTNVRAPIYMILRKTDNPREFRLIAACPHLAFFLMTKIAMPAMPAMPRRMFEPVTSFEFVEPVPSCKPLPLGDLQESLHENLATLRSFYDHDISSSVDEEYLGIQKRFLFPGKRGPVTFKEVLPLLLGIAGEKHKQKFKSLRGFQELYLESIDPKFQPRVSNGFCELSLDAEDKEEIVNLLDCYVYGAVMKGWSMGAEEEGTSRVVLRRSMSVIGVEMMAMVSASYNLDLVELVDNLVCRLEDADVGERIMAGPVEEDHFRGGTHFRLDPVLREFGLDGSTFRVRMV